MEKIIVSKYGLQENGWDGGLERYGAFRSPWKFISRIYPVFHQFVRVVARGGNKVRFWEDGGGMILILGSHPILFQLLSFIISPFLILSRWRTTLPPLLYLVTCICGGI